MAKITSAIIALTTEHLTIADEGTFHGIKLCKFNELTLYESFVCHWCLYNLRVVQTVSDCAKKYLY